MFIYSVNWTQSSEVQLCCIRSHWTLNQSMALEHNVPRRISRNIAAIPHPPTQQLAIQQRSKLSKEDPDKTIDCFHWVNLWCFLVHFYTHETLILEKIDWFLVFNANFNNISAISWRPGLVVEEAGVPGEQPTMGKQLVNLLAAAGRVHPFL